MQKRQLGRMASRYPPSASAAWACRSSTASATTPSRSRPSTARSSSASPSSTPPTCTARTRTRSWSAARSRAGATRSCSPPSSASCATRRTRFARRQRQARLRAPGLRRQPPAAGRRRRSISTTSTASIPTTPIEDTVGAMAELVSEGKVRYLGLSEAGAATTLAARTQGASHHRAADRVLAVDAATPRTRVLADVPRARHRLRRLQPARPRLPHRADQDASRTSRPTTTAATRRASRARTSQKNLELVARVEEMAKEKGCTPSQLALAWVLAQGDDIVPIPGTKRREVSRGEHRRARRQAHAGRSRASRRADAARRRSRCALFGRHDARRQRVERDRHTQKWAA